MVAEAQAVPRPLTLEGLRAHLGDHPDRSRPDQLVYFYDAHTYYDLEKPERIEAAKSFKEKMQKQFPPNTDTFYYGPTHLKHVGPHYEGQWKVVFTRHSYVELLNWLEINRPLELSILIHPHTLDSAVDHTHRALWLGPSYNVKTDMLNKIAAKNKQKLDEGADEVELLWQTHR